MQPSILLPHTHHNASLLLAALVEPQKQWLLEHTPFQPTSSHNQFPLTIHTQASNSQEMQYGRASQGIF
ncbi:MAG: hypothetical protein H9535_20350 [Ignavibacteria bacterium]|nr:hypothetical protein [Ignavibacteria bacterium]